MTEPTAIPALAPVESPPPGEWAGVAVCEAGSPVLDGVLEEDGVGDSNSSLVTLKQGTWMLKSLVSIKV